MYGKLTFKLNFALWSSFQVEFERVVNGLGGQKSSQQSCTCILSGSQLKSSCEELKSHDLFLDTDKLQLHLAVSGYICCNDTVTIDACGMHEICVFAEALKLQLGWNGCSGNR